jgi:N6-L-threonylcarbamoyladenine synthase
VGGGVRCLAFDTATPRLTVAVGTADEGLAALDVWAPRDHMARLFGQIQHVLREAGGLEMQDLEAIVVGVGPGSFTGVRIGVAAAKAVARAAGLPLYGVPSPDAVAEGLTCAARPIVVVADAARGEVYPMLYTRLGGRLERLGEGFTVARAADAALAMAGETEGTPAGAGAAPLLAGDGLVLHLDVFLDALSGAEVAPRADWYPRAGALIARAHALAESQSGDPDTVLPIYTRLSDAEEIERAGGSGGAAAGAGETGAAP